MTNPISNDDSQAYIKLAQNFLKRVIKTTDRNEFTKAFDGLDPDVQEYVIRELGNPSYSKLIEFMPCEKYGLIYNKAIKADTVPSGDLVRGISTFYFEDAKDLLIYVFQEAKDQGVCEAAAEGLAKFKQGLDILEAALQSENTIQQVSAADGIDKNVNADSPLELIEIIKRYRTHENHQVRMACIRGLYRSKNLSSEYLRASLEDENEYVRRQTMYLVRNIDRSTAKDYVELSASRR